MGDEVKRIDFEEEVEYRSQVFVAGSVVYDDEMSEEIAKRQEKKNHTVQPKEHENMTAQEVNSNEPDGFYDNLTVEFFDESEELVTSVGGDDVGEVIKKRRRRRRKKTTDANKNENVPSEELKTEDVQSSDEELEAEDFDSFLNDLRKELLDGEDKVVKLTEQKVTKVESKIEEKVEAVAEDYDFLENIRLELLKKEEEEKERLEKIRLKLEEEERKLHEETFVKIDSSEIQIEEKPKKSKSKQEFQPMAEIKPKAKKGLFETLIAQIQSMFSKPEKKMEESKQVTDAADSTQEEKHEVQPIVDVPILTETTVDEPEVQVPEVDEPITDQQATDEQATNQQATDEQATDQQATDQQATDQQATDQQTTDQQSIDKQATDESTTVEQVIDMQVVGKVTEIQGVILGGVTGEHVVIYPKAMVRNGIWAQGQIHAMEESIALGEIRCRRLIVDGTVRGTVYGSEEVIIGDNGVVIGDIYTPNIVLSPRAIVEGHILDGKETDRK